MNTTITTIQLYVDPAHAGYLEKLKQDIAYRVKLDGKHHGEQNKPNTEPELRALILNLIQTTLQGGIDRNQEVYQPISGMFVAKQIMSDAQKKVAGLVNIRRDNEHKLGILRKEAEVLKPDLRLIRARKLAKYGMAIIAITDGILSYKGFRFASFPLIGAIGASTGVAAAIYFGAEYLGKYIAKATTPFQKRLRWLKSLVPYGTSFYGLAVLRARAYNHVTHYAGGTPGVVLPNHATALSIACMSFLFYWLALFLSVHFYKSDEELKREQDYVEKSNEVIALEGLIKANEDECSATMQKANTEASLALAKYEYALSCECGLKTFAKQIAEEYKTINLRFRTDGKCPEFFARIPEFQFTTFFDNVKPKQHEDN
jgi:hypothetical protein